MSNEITVVASDTQNRGLLLTEYNSIREYFKMKNMQSAYEKSSDKKILFCLNNNLPIFKSIGTVPNYVLSNTDFMAAYNSHDKQKTIPVFLNRDGIKHWAIFTHWW